MKNQDQPKLPPNGDNYQIWTNYEYDTDDDEIGYIWLLVPTPIKVPCPHGYVWEGFRVPTTNTRIPGCSRCWVTYYSDPGS